MGRDDHGLCLLAGRIVFSFDGLDIRHDGLAQCRHQRVLCRTGALHGDLLPASSGWLLENGPRFARDIINSLRDIGAAAGATRTLTPSTPIDIAFDIIGKAADNYSVLSPIDNLAIFFDTCHLGVHGGGCGERAALALVTAW